MLVKCRFLDIGADLARACVERDMGKTRRFRREGLCPRKCSYGLFGHRVTPLLRAGLLVHQGLRG